MESEDEEIIFENSALHKALKETGVENIDTEPLVSKDNGISNERTDSGMCIEDDKFHRVPTDFFTKMVLSENEITSVHKCYQQKTLVRLKSSPLLSNDDKDFLQSFMDDETNKTESLKCSQPSIWSNLNLIRVMVCGLGFGACLLASLCLMVDTSQYLPGFFLMIGTDKLTVSVTLAFGLAFILCLLKVIFFLKVCREMNKMDCIIQDFEESAKKLSRIERKCIRRIRESELAARGFTLASVSSCLSSDTNLLTRIDKLCPDFRASFIAGNLDIFGHLKDSYKYITESIPLIVEFNWVDVKSDQIPTECWLTSSDSSGLNKSSTNLSENGDNESPSENFIRISQLASSQELLNIQLSTFMRRLVLSFYANHYKDVLVNPYKAVSKSVLICQKSMDSVADVLTKNQSFYRAIHKTVRRHKVSDTQTEVKKSKSPLESFYVCVNSLDLHLEKVLEKTRDLTVHLGALVDEQEVSMNETPSVPVVGSINPEDRAAWEDNLKKIKLDLDLCKSCYEEGMKVLSRTEVKASTKIIQPNNTQDASPSSNQQDPLQKRINIIPDSDPIIEDQVFEAVIDSDGEEEEPPRPSYTVEQKAQIRQQREDLTRFKQELKAVVDHRAIGQRKREEKALARTRGELPLNAASESDESSEDVENDKVDEGESSIQVIKNSEILIESQVDKLETSNHEWDKVSSKSESVLLDENKHSEKFSMLAAKLDSADSNGYVKNPTNSLPPWLSLAQRDGTAANSQSSQSNRSKSSSSRSKQSAQALPYDEGWRSSIERSKARHWEMCEKIIQENKDAYSDNKLLDATQPNHNDLDTSSFVDISSSDDLLFYPIDTEIHFENGARASIRPDKNSSSSSNSQLAFPHSVNPEEEGFRNLNGTYVSRHNFTASGRNSMLNKALRDLERQKRQEESQDEDDEQVVHPNRKRHRAGDDTSKWVNISYVELVSGNGNQYNLYRQKDMTSDDIANRSPNCIPSPEPGSSLNSSLAVMAAARAKHFNLGVEEQFNDDGEADDNYEVLCSSGRNGDLSREMTIQSEVA